MSVSANVVVLEAGAVQAGFVYSSPRAAPD